MQEEKLLKERVDALEKEAVESGTRNASVDMKWPEVSEEEQPDRLRKNPRAGNYL